MSGSLASVRLRDANPAQRERAEALYLDAFPAEERVPLPELRARDAADRDPVSVVLAAGDPVALVAVTRLGAPAWSLLQYLAVSPALRGAGLGSAIWRAEMRRLTTDHPQAGLVMEVEHPYLPGLAPPAAALRLRRLRFYTRLGARQLMVTGYAAPDLRGGGDPVPMLLLAAPGPRAALPRDDAARLVARLYEVAYGLAGDHPLVAGALASVR